jgi:DNA replication and repair protein RecF
MHLTRLRVSRLRCLAEAELELDPGLNVVVGANGAGKSSLVEAVHLLAYGRSFRGRVRDGLVRTGATSLEVYAEWQEDGQAHRAGIRHSGQEWEARLDGSPVSRVTDLCARFAAVTFEPGSHALLGGGADQRRRYLDWGLFHVEPGFLATWRRYSRALKQRNALLKTRPPSIALDPWDHELAEAGETLTRQRQAYLVALEPELEKVSAAVLPELGSPKLEFQPGWKAGDLSLADALLLARERDMVMGYSTTGPHRADWRLGFEGLPGRETLSRGQEKLAALACLMAQAERHALRRGEWPVICLDDVASELDGEHQRQVLASVLASGAQVLLTGTEVPESVASLEVRHRLFHVEHGQLRTA